ncbi:MarR family transcriptional regulator [Silvibacterium dinghuense]|uniref:MarR family transcriptional regulator n=2 Tax=Silvibacterium dinghuense TaxID=1560006 RepID=A0A4Q1SA36_9BACT|nr:MarR family transcriptional regulator [Silvibacterium dinghuense]GGH07550.1 hypothetical protein GCM10011586_24870 [Silvibacterium dinghuense]
MLLVDQVRSFNRFYTREIGLLAEHLPQSRFSLAEARVLYELAQPGERTAADILRNLGMDKAHVSRIVARFREAGLLKFRISPEHGRHKLLSLTAAGKKAFRQLNDGTESQIETLLAPLTVERRKRLAEGMREVRNVLEGKPAAAADVQFRGLRVGDLGWITHRQAVLYEQEYGWDWTYEGLVSRILGDFAANFDASREDAWVAELNGEVVGSVFLMKTEQDEVAKLRLLYVDPVARGLGVGSRLVRMCVERARELGYRRLVLWTNDVLSSARKIYVAAGFTLSEENRHHSFGKDLVGQVWTLELDRAQNLPQGVSTYSSSRDLSSRPEHSGVEGPAVLSTQAQKGGRNELSMARSSHERRKALHYRGRQTSPGESAMQYEEIYEALALKRLDPVQLNEVPPGIYAVFLVTRDVLTVQAGQGSISIPTEQGLLYIGMTADAAGRRNHFTAEHSGTSSPRRTLGALLQEELSLHAIPRGPQTDRHACTNYRFPDHEEIKLTQWMYKNLFVSHYPIDGSRQEIEHIEKQLLECKKPPLNLTGPARDKTLRLKIKQLRKACRDEACRSRK